MKKAKAAQLTWAGRLLAHEGGDAFSAERCAEAAGRIYDKIHEELAPLLGAAGVQALLARSARLARDELAFPFDVEVLPGSAKLREQLAGLDPPVAMATATALFGILLTLVTTFIGERLTSQALRKAWPALEEPTTGESKK